MYDRVKINVQPDSKANITINKELAEKLNIAKRKRGFVSFGVKRLFADILISEELAYGEIVLSEKLVKKLHIPTYPVYEVKVKNTEIMLGPCIGILACQKNKDLSKRMLKEISLNAIDYGRINGAIITFSLDKVNKENNTIEGYCYNPKKEIWEKGIFPYPLSIYRRSRLSKQWENHFLTFIGDSTFNNYSFDKWEMYEWFSNEGEIAKHIPYTKIYENKEDIFQMLEKYESIYAKPIGGMKGFGVIKINKEGEKIRFRYRKEELNEDILLEEGEDLDKSIDDLMKPGEFIIQQGINLINYDGGQVDFRCVMQKNETRKWQCNSIITRVGAKESVVSNISSGGAAMPAMDFIKAAGLATCHTEAFILKEKLISLCMKVCEALDKYGFNFGTLGLDLGVDNNKDIWLIEVNNRRPHPGIALRASDIQSYYNILSGPLRYAKALAGFGSKEEDKDAL
ncbi:MAG: YheC/YheD family protein [Clostridiales bacterium]|uniref:YheC/YheD family endospore coat-associated protein n=1 Tax=Clostridium sp. N3C TaxID=1776758 RepID=UPI00092DEF9E|nr:YheC/YheD family protein [Clostridium sp. N3C]NLZ49953.1 YheC/YheD family protein [Clostridiales bacterium]SCN22701.1 Endospore coat-associated protein YheD [Clostridium sp. N3C]